MADRAAFLNRIREAAARGRAHRAAVNPAATSEAAYVGGGEDPVATLLEEWRAVGGLGQRIRGPAAAREALREIARSEQVRSAIRWRHPLLERLAIDEALAAENIPVAAWDELAAQAETARRETAFAADLGITSVDWAVAETGTLALASGPGQGRVVSLLPPVFVAVVEPAQIVPDLFDLFQRLEAAGADLPSGLVLVTGPSKTGDIELKLTTGVHGPGRVHLLVVEPE